LTNVDQRRRITTPLPSNFDWSIAGLGPGDPYTTQILFLSDALRDNRVAR
jgi:hypothetical protein